MTLQLIAPLYAVTPEWEYNGYDDSDFYRVMYNPNTGKLERVMTWTTRAGCGYDMTVTGAYAKRNNLHGYLAYEYKRDFDGKADYVTTNNVRVALPVRWFVLPEHTPAQVWEAAEQAYANIIFAQLLASDKQQASRPGKGKRCKVVNGRKIAKGETVTVLGAPVPDVFNGHNNGEKVLVQTTTKGALKTNLRNLEVINPEQFEAPESELRAKAREIAARRDFYPAFRTSGVSMV